MPLACANKQKDTNTHSIINKSVCVTCCKCKLENKNPNYQLMSMEYFFSGYSCAIFNSGLKKKAFKTVHV